MAAPTPAAVAEMLERLRGVCAAAEPVRCTHAPALSRVSHRQRGSNCREVALANLARLDAEPTVAELRPLMAALLRDQFPKELAAVPDVSTLAVQWTLHGQAGTNLMTRFLERSGDVGVALLCAPPQLPALRRLFGGREVVDCVVEDPATWGMLYFSSSHCMSVLHDNKGVWWNVPQSTRIQIPATAVRSTLDNLLRKQTGCVVTLSRDYCAQVLAPSLLHTLGEDPLLAARIARRCLRGTEAVFTEEPQHTWHCREAMALPSPLWTAETFAGVEAAARAWLLAAIQG